MNAYTSNRNDAETGPQVRPTVFPFSNVPIMPAPPVREGKYPKTKKLWNLHQGFTQVLCNPVTFAI